jgi:hypothetical protein
MAVEGVGNLIQNLADQLFGQGPAGQAGTRVPDAGGTASGTAVEDTFTPSTQTNFAPPTAQDAGIFQLSPGPLTTVAVGILSAQAPPDAVQPAAPGQDGAAAAPNPGLSAAQTALAASGTTTNSAQDASGPAASAELQNKIRQLNASLPALGLTNNEIQQIDRIASMIKDFITAAYTDLVNQFEALAQQSAQQNAEGAAQPSVAGAPATPGTGSNPNNGGFQVQQIVIQFADSQGTPSSQPGSGGQSSAANPSPSNAPGLQVEQVQFTLTNASGQTAQVQTPHPVAGSITKG